MRSGWLYAAIAIGVGRRPGWRPGWIGRVRRQGVALIGGGGRCGAPRSPWPGWRTALWLAVLLLAVGGAADLVSAVYRQTILQTYAPDEMRGRLQGVFTVVVAGGPRLGDLRAGATAGAVGADRRRGSGGGIACVGRRRGARGAVAGARALPAAGRCRRGRPSELGVDRAELGAGEQLLDRREHVVGTAPRERDAGAAVAVAVHDTT